MDAGFGVWRDAARQHPWRSGDYLCACRFAEFPGVLFPRVMFYRKKANIFSGEGDEMRVAYWMPLPDMPPPEGK